MNPHAGARPAGYGGPGRVKAFTDPLEDDYRKRGNPVTYKTYEGVDHGEVVTDARAVGDATRYIRARVR